MALTKTRLLKHDFPVHGFLRLTKVDKHVGQIFVTVFADVGAHFFSPVFHSWDFCT